MERGDVARLFNVADAEVHHYLVNDDSVSVVLTGNVARLWTPDGIFAVNECPQNRAFRRLPDDLLARGGFFTEEPVYWVGERGPEPVLVPAEPTVDDSDPGDEGEDVVPDGTADQVLSWVDGDPDRAARAIEAEEKRDKPRTVLLTNLKRVASS